MTACCDSFTGIGPRVGVGSPTRLQDIHEKLGVDGRLKLALHALRLGLT